MTWITFLEELTRVVSYGGVGALAGFTFGVWFTDRHRLTTAILNESERDVHTPPLRMSTDRLQSLVVIVVMIAMLLTGLVWIQGARSNAEQDRRDCLRAQATATALASRTLNYLESAEAERRLWNDIRRQFVRSGADEDSPLLTSIDRYREVQAEYIEHLRANPVPSGSESEC